MNRINPEKLALSKWTAVHPVAKRKHFMVTDLIRNERDLVIACVLEAVIDQHSHTLAWRELTDENHWLTGWR